MALFEQIGRRLTDAGQSVAQQTRNLSETVRLSGAVAEKEKLLSQHYQELGKIHYELYRDVPDSGARERIEAISALLAEIAGYQEEIKRLKGSTRCACCGAEMAANSVFCSTCGAQMSQPKAVSAEEDICPRCAEPVSKGNRFCNHCGAKIDKNND